jgi:hypothetical protein
VRYRGLGSGEDGVERGIAGWRGRCTAAVAAALAVLLGEAAPAAAGGAAPPTASEAVGSAVDPSARLPAGGSAWEYWEITAPLESGHLVASRFLITNAGPGDRNGIAIGRVIEPDGQVHEFRNGRLEKRWTLSEDRLRLDVSSSHLDLHGPEHRLWIDKRRVQIDLRYRPVQGALLPPDLLPPGYHLEVIAAAAPIEGSLWLEGMEAPLAVRGRAAVTHTWGKPAEVDLALRRIEALGVSGDDAVYLVDLTTPDGVRKRWLGLSQGSALRFATGGFALGLEGAARDRSDAPYWVPGTLALGGDGVGGSIRIERTLAEGDPLAALPGPIRFLQSLSMRPRRVWAASSVDVTVQPRADADGAWRVRGSGIVWVSFLDALERPDGRAASGQELLDVAGVQPGQPIREGIEGPDLAGCEDLRENREADSRRE